MPAPSGVGANGEYIGSASSNVDESIFGRFPRQHRGLSDGPGKPLPSKNSSWPREEHARSYCYGKPPMPSPSLRLGPTQILRRTPSTTHHDAKSPALQADK